MTAAQRQRMSREQFLAWEERQERRFEFDGFQAVAMTGGTVPTIALLSMCARRWMPA
jgi:hypothetical protein